MGRGLLNTLCIPYNNVMMALKAQSRVDTHLDTAHLLGYPVHLVTSLQARTFVKNAIEQRKTIQVVTLNPEMIMQGDQNRELGDILRSSELILPDGAGVVWALRRQGYQVSRLPGIEFSESLLSWAEEAGRPIAIVGATRQALELAVETLQKRHPKLKIAYSHHGFFKTDDEENLIAQSCAAALPKIVLVALGVPRQELWIQRHRHLFPGATLIGVGGSLDVWSGRTQRAPAWMRALNLEWLYRITTEPWRIKRIYKTLPLFVVKVLLFGNNS